MSNFLSGVAVVLSTLALMLSGFTAYQVFTLQQKISTASNTASTGAIASNQSDPASPPSQVNPQTGATPTASTASGGIQPQQFVQNALGTKAQVELLSLKRIEDPEAGTRDIVNVQSRIRRMTTENPSGSDMINVGTTTARNPDTSETYKAVDSTKRSTGVVSLFSIRPRSSVDAYVWLRVPEGVNSLDIYIPET
ncbi:MAG TPA: hypothetical protein DEV81_22870, partial [Cyanobacteria bacterium UBA11049]|nr:hypothetical protein [Cyanobacteria bacterium UBA11049]